MASVLSEHNNRNRVNIIKCEKYSINKTLKRENFLITYQYTILYAAALLGGRQINNTKMTRCTLT